MHNLPPDVCLKAHATACLLQPEEPCFSLRHVCRSRLSRERERADLSNDNFEEFACPGDGPCAVQGGCSTALLRQPPVQHCERALRGIIKCSARSIQPGVAWCFWCRLTVTLWAPSGRVADFFHLLAMSEAGTARHASALKCTNLACAEWIRVGVLCQLQLHASIWPYLNRIKKWPASSLHYKPQN